MSQHTAGARRRDRSWGAALALGAGALALRYLTSRAGDPRRTGLVDWPSAEAIAIRRLARASGRLSDAELAASEGSYNRAMERIVPLLERTLGVPLPGVVERHAVVSRAEWAQANLVTFRHLVGRLEEQLLDELRPRGPGIAPALTALANRFLTTQQIGFLLGYLGSRVLGQYDVALLSAEAPPGKLLFVEENIRAVAAGMDVPLNDFRTWIALHETTHAFELEAHPWVRPYLADRLERQLGGFLQSARGLSGRGPAELLRRLRDLRGEHPLAGFMSVEQRVLLRETQLVMSLLEGFSDWVMDEVGAELVSDVPRLRERFEARRAQRRGGIDRLVARITGLDMKLEQYRRGDRFVAGVAASGGREAVGHLWDGPHALPTEQELNDPSAWVRRVVGR